VSREPLRVAVVGLGLMGSVMVKAFDGDPAWELVAVCDPDPASCDRALEGRPQTVASGDSSEVCDGAFLDSHRIDFVAIASPPSSHADLSSRVLRAGRHVLCEKPLSPTAPEADEMTAEAARHPDCLALVDFQLRFNPARRWLRDRLRAGLVGEPRLVTIVAGFPSLLGTEWTWWSDKRAGGGLLNEYGSHLVDLLQWLFGPVDLADGLLRTGESERPFGTVMRPVDSDDVASFRLAWRSGLVADIVLSTFIRPNLRRLSVHGDEGSMVIDKDDQITYYPGQGDRPVVEDLAEPMPSLIGSATDSFSQPFLRLVREVAIALREGREPVDVATFGDGRSVVRVLERIRLSDQKESVAV